MRRYDAGRGDGIEALVVVRGGQLERVIDLGRLPEIEPPSGHPYRSAPVEVERLLIDAANGARAIS